MDLNDLHLSSSVQESLQESLDAAHEKYVKALEKLQKDAVGLAQGVLYEDGLDLAVLRTEVYERYATRASELSKQYYSTVRELWKTAAGVDMPDFPMVDIDADRAAWQEFGGFADTDFNGLTYKQVATGANRSGMGFDDLWAKSTGKMDAAQLANLASRIIATAARLTMERNAAVDPTQPRYARVPSGATTCAFCVMCASRGFAYNSSETAGELKRYHPDDDCRIVPSWGKGSVKDYDPDKYASMYDAAKKDAGSTNAKKVAAAMRRLYPDDVRDGLYEQSGEWPENVIRPYAAVWRHVFDGHGPNASAPGKTRFPSEWSEKKIRWAVQETIISPDLSIPTKDGNRENRYKIIEDQIIRVWLQKRRDTGGRFMINTAHPVTEQQKERLWQQMHRP